MNKLIDKITASPQLSFMFVVGLVLAGALVINVLLAVLQN